ncbi:MAG: Ig-like domain repeat protein, partial [Candidatus Bathyarchaeia archaeon]
MLLTSLLSALSIYAPHPARGVDNARIEDVGYPNKVYDGEVARLIYRIGNPSITAIDGFPRFFLRLYLDGSLMEDELPKSWECPKGESRERVIDTPPLHGPRDHVIRGELYWLNQSIAILQDVRTIEIKAVKLQVVDFSQSISEVTLGGSQPLKFQVQFSNGGNDVIYDATLIVAGPPGVEVNPKRASVGDIPIGESAEINLELSTEPPISQGYVEVSYEISYKDFKGNPHMEEFRVGLSILKASSNLQLIIDRGEEIVYTSEVTLRAHLTGLGGRALPREPVEFYIDNRSVGVSITDDKGEAVIKVDSTLEVGIHEVKALYRGSSNYDPSSMAKSLRVLPATTHLSLVVSSSTIRVGEETVVYVKLIDDQGLPIQNAEILLYCEEALIARGLTNSTGEAEIPIVLDSSGFKSIKAVYNGDVNHRGVEKVEQINAKPLQTLLRIQAPSQAWKGDRVTYRISLTDELGEPIRYALMSVEISAKNLPVVRLSLKTDDSGTAVGIFNATVGGQLRISANYGGDQRYAPAEASHSLTVMDSSIIALMVVPVTGA